MPSFRFEHEHDIQCSVEVCWTGSHSPGRSHGDPDDCYPPETEADCKPLQLWMEGKKVPQELAKPLIAWLSERGVFAALELPDFPGDSFDPDYDD
jgi:hypothetical protein